MNSPKDLPAYSTSSTSFKLAWLCLSLLGVFAVVANGPALRRVFLLSALIIGVVMLIRRWLDWRALRPFMPWIAITLGSAYWSMLPKTSLIDSLWEVLCPIAVFFAATVIFSRVEKRFYWTAFWLAAGAAVLAVLGGLHGHLGVWSGMPKAIFAAYSGRGVASTAGVFLTLIGFSVILINQDKCYGQQAKSLYFLGALLVLLGAALGILGHNRMYWFAVFVGLLPWLGLLRQVSLRLRLLSVIGVLLLVVSGVVYSSYLARTQEPVSADLAITQIERSYLADSRWKIWGRWLDVAGDRVLLGYGYGTRVLPRIGEKYVVSISPEEDESGRHHAHNVFINVVVQTGLLGLACFLWMLFGIWQVIGNKTGLFAGPDEQRKWKIAAASLLLAALAKSMTDDFFWGPATILMWLFAGIFAAGAQRK